MAHDRKKFTYTKVFGAYRHRTTRFSVIVPLLGVRRGKLSEQPQLLDTLRSRWISKLIELKQAGWYGLPSDKSVVYACNCPPFGVRTQTKTLPCNRQLICPFCYARRRVLAPFRRLETALYGVSGPYMQGQSLWETEKNLAVTKGKPLLPVLLPDHRIVWFRGRVQTRAFGWEFDFDNLRPQVCHARDYIGRTRRLEIDNFRPKHACMQFTVYPSLRFKSVTVIRSGVFLCHKDTASDELKKYLGLPIRPVGGLLEPSKRNLGRAIYRAFHYPNQLFRLPPRMVAATLNELKSARLCTVYGKLNSKITFEKPHQRERDEPSEDGWW